MRESLYPLRSVGRVLSPLLLLSLGACTATRQVQTSGPVQRVESRLVLEEAELRHPVQARWEIHKNQVEGQLGWRALCTALEVEEKWTELREETGPSVPAGVGFLIGAVAAGVASGWFFHESSQADAAEFCTVDGQEAPCESETGTLLGAAVGLGLLSLTSAAFGVGTWVQPRESHVLEELREEEIREVEKNQACGTPRDLAGMEIILRQGDTKLSHGFVDETGHFVIEMPLMSEEEQETLSLELIQVPIHVRHLVPVPYELTVRSEGE